MKSVPLWKINFILFISLICSTILIGCSTENDNSSLQQKTEGSNLFSENAQRKTGLYPENTANIYDDAGQLHNEISESYLAAGLVSTTTAETLAQVETLAEANAKFQSLLPTGYTPCTSFGIDSILNNPQGVIPNSILTVKSKSSLISFLNTLMLYRDLSVEYETMYQFIINYELSIISDESMSLTDRKIILTTTSISRYAFYFAKKHKRKPRDRDWEIMWANIVAGSEGSEESMHKGIIMAVVCGIILNK